MLRLPQLPRPLGVAGVCQGQPPGVARPAATTQPCRPIRHTPPPSPPPRRRTRELLLRSSADVAEAEGTLEDMAQLICNLEGELAAKEQLAVALKGGCFQPGLAEVLRAGALAGTPNRRAVRAAHNAAPHLVACAPRPPCRAEVAAWQQHRDKMEAVAAWAPVYASERKLAVRRRAGGTPQHCSLRASLLASEGCRLGGRGVGAAPAAASPCRNPLLKSLPWPRPAGGEGAPGGAAAGAARHLPGGLPHGCFRLPATQGKHGLQPRRPACCAAASAALA